MGNIYPVSGGYIVHGDVTRKSTRDTVRSFMERGKCAMVMADPPYGNIVDTAWDRVNDNDHVFSQWMTSWVDMYADTLLDGGAFYLWGGIGRHMFRPFFRFLANIETPDFQLANLITWSKKRAYGVPHNYLFTREELAYFVRGDARKPRVFNIPLLEEKRGYSGYNAKYPAKSEFLRRTNVWTDVTELLRNKVHPTQKADRVVEVPIEVSTNPGDWVVDLFSGSGTTGIACRKLGRNFVLVESDAGYVKLCRERLG
jgi:site-specific DNA-methyltransferase (adenine-specific)